MKKWLISLWYLLQIWNRETLVNYYCDKLPLGYYRVLSVIREQDGIVVLQHTSMSGVVKTVMTHDWCKGLLRKGVKVSFLPVLQSNQCPRIHVM